MHSQGERESERVRERREREREKRESLTDRPTHVHAYPPTHQLTYQPARQPMHHTGLNIYGLLAGTLLIPPAIIGIGWLSLFFEYKFKVYRRGVDAETPGGKAMADRFYDEMMHAATIVLFFMYSSLCSQIFDVFNFHEVRVEGKLLLRADYSIDTTSVSYWIGSFFAITGIFVYVFGVPGLAARILYLNKDELKEERTRQRYGFLYDGEWIWE